MNRTCQLGIFNPTVTISGYPWTGNDEISKPVFEDAKAYFSVLYPEAKYNAYKDVFEYRGLEFDYFISGIKLNFGDPSEGSSVFGYTLVDPQNPSNWLFSYGEKDERWFDFLEKKRRHISFKNRALEEYEREHPKSLINKIVALFKS